MKHDYIFFLATANHVNKLCKRMCVSANACEIDEFSISNLWLANFCSDNGLQLFGNINGFLLIITDQISPVCLLHTTHSLIRIRQNRRGSAILNFNEWTLTWAHHAHAQANKFLATNISINLATKKKSTNSMEIDEFAITSVYLQLTRGDSITEKSVFQNSSRTIAVFWQRETH